MKQTGLLFFQHTELVAIGMILFLAVFIGVVIQVMSKSNQVLYKEIENLPLQDEADHV